jgi:hypothetical protein
MGTYTVRTYGKKKGPKIGALPYHFICIPPTTRSIMMRPTKMTLKNMKTLSNCLCCSKPVSRQVNMKKNMEAYIIQIKTGFSHKNASVRLVLERIRKMKIPHKAIETRK